MDRPNIWDVLLILKWILQEFCAIIRTLFVLKIVVIGFVLACPSGANSKLMMYLWLSFYVYKIVLRLALDETLGVQQLDVVKKQFLDIFFFFIFCCLLARKV